MASGSHALNYISILAGPWWKGTSKAQLTLPPFSDQQLNKDISRASFQRKHAGLGMNLLFEKMAQEPGLAKSRLTGPHLLGHSTSTDGTKPSSHVPQFLFQTILPGTTQVPCSWMMKAKSWTRITATLETYDTQDWGSLLIFDLDTQRTNDVASHVMNRGVKSLNWLHLVCLKFNESNLERIFSNSKFWILKRYILYVLLHTEKGENPLKNYQYQGNCNWAMELSLLQPKTSFPNTEMRRSFLEYPTILFDSCFFQMRQGFGQDFPNFVKRSTALEKKYWNSSPRTILLRKMSCMHHMYR